MTAGAMRTAGAALAGLLLAAFVPAAAATFEVGPGAGMLASPSDVPWESLAPGDRVVIHWRAQPYAAKWVLCRRGTAEAPIVISGVPGPNRELPVIDGRNAVTRTQLDYWNEVRGVLKIGGANVPPDTVPAYLVVENLDIRSGRPPFTFTNTDGGVATYAANAAAIYVEKAEHLTIRNCILRDSGNGLFVGVYDGATRDILIERCFIHDNGIEGSIYEHNAYTAALGITYQLNRFGPLRAGCGGNNLKDRSAGLVVRSNWIEGGNRQLDLVDGEDSPVVVNDPAYRTTFVYGNVLIEHDGSDNSQIVHYGGDSGNTDDYRKGTLHLYHNTVVSLRTGNTTLVRLSTNDEHADVRDNVVFTTASGSHLALLAQSGVMDLRRCWLPTGWVTTHDGGFEGTLIDHGGHVVGTDPGFVDLSGLDLSPAPGSPCIDSGVPLNPDVLPGQDAVIQYLRHQRGSWRSANGPRDLGAFEAGLLFADSFESGDALWWSAAVP